MKALYKIFLAAIALYLGNGIVFGQEDNRDAFYKNLYQEWEYKGCFWENNYSLSQMWEYKGFSYDNNYRQEVYIKAVFSDDRNDMDAQIYKRTPPNDSQPYALIKVSSTQAGYIDDKDYDMDFCANFISFDFGTHGFGIIDCSRGTWVYAPADATRMTITCKSFYFPEQVFISPLEAGAVYHLELDYLEIIE